MEMMDLGLKLLSGGITGYLTNSLAINMLFKKYGPFGGMILKTREEFTRNLSILVEKDIINQKVLEQELSSPRLEVVFRQIVQEILTEHLWANLNYQCIDEIPGFKRSLVKFQEFSDRQRGRGFSLLLDSLLSQLKITDLLGREHLEVLLKNISQLLIQHIQETDLLEDFLRDFIEEKADQSFGEFFSPGFLEIIENNLLSITGDLQTKIAKNCDHQIDQFLANLYSDLEITALLKKLEDELKAKSLVELLGKENLQKIGGQCLQIVLDFFQTEPGQDLFKQMIHDGWNLLKEIELSVIDLFTPELRLSLERFITENLPQVLAKLLSWVKENQVELEALLEEAIAETLDEESTKFLAGKLKKSLYELFFQGKKTNFLTMLQKLLTDNQDELNLLIISKQMTREVINLLKTEPIGRLIRSLEAKNILQATDLTNLLEANLERFLHSIDFNHLELFFHTKLADLFSGDLTKNGHLRGLILNKFKTQILSSELVLESVRNHLREQFWKINRLPLAELLATENMGKNIAILKATALQQVAESQRVLVKPIASNLFELVKDKKLSEILDQRSQNDLVIKISQSSFFTLKDRLNGLKSIEIHDYFTELIRRENRAEEISELVLCLIIDNLPRLLKGRIAGLVQKRLTQVSDRDFQNMIEKFMGSELKPITFFGGLLGIGAAGVLFFIQKTIGGDQLLRIPLSTLTYGFVGYMTNVLALKMIFKPYDEKKLWGLKIPFTPGVVAKEKPRFAKAMGRFVGENLLNQETVVEIFTQNRQSIADQAFKTISQNNYQLVEEHLRKEFNHQFVSERIFTYLINLPTITREEFIQTNLGYLAKLNLERFDLAFLEPTLRDLSHKALASAPNLLADYLTEFLEDEPEIGELFPELWQRQFLMLANSLEAKFSQWDQALIADKLSGLAQGSAVEKFMKTPLRDLLASFRGEKLNQDLANLLLTTLGSGHFREYLVNFFQEKIALSLDPDTEIKNLFAGKLLANLEKNAQGFVDSSLQRFLKIISQQREPLTKNVLKAFQQESGFLFILGNFLDFNGTVRRVIDRLIDQKIPKFFQDKRTDFSNLWVDFLEKIGQKKVGDLKIDLKRLDLNKMADSFLESELLEKNLVNIVTGFVNSTSDLSINSFLERAQLAENFQLAQIFAPEIDLLKSELSSQLLRKKKLICQRVFTLIKQMMEEQIFRLPVTEITRGISPSEIGDSLNRSFQKIFQSKAFDHSFSLLVKEFVSRVQKNDLTSILHFNHLASDLSKTLTKITENSELRDQLKEKLTQLVSLVLSNLNQILEPEMKDYLLNGVINSTMDAIENNFLELINSINVRAVTEEQINAMEPEKIENLFDSFAGKYFRKLESYGWIGSIFGLMELLRLL